MANVSDQWMETADVIAPQRHLILSPHYDDAALSCGGLMTLVSTAQRQLDVALLFGAEPNPEEPLTDFAIFQHKRWGMPPDEVIAGRRQEEATAMRVLGARTLQLPFADAIYRGNAYADEQRLFSPPVATEATLPLDIVDALELTADQQHATRIYAPCALGGHVDHRLAHQTGAELMQRGWNVWFYEDQPYALQMGDDELVNAINDDGHQWESLLVDVSTSWENKIAAIMTYSSQLPVIFRHVTANSTAAEIDMVLADYARRMDRNHPQRLAERYWRTLL